ncbi:isoniazid-induced protein IniC [Zafaria cholistanensis]|uniref:Isoniazid-induced protein IniC n=1 Tax=Zafaria cholistanensis TaxID=1682741 RepID=A0A5A7NRI2_9MICC|nr:GTP-binding protein [Zafaria cholistanensis]GER23453.1 isoniazid-induced protein IniC [Zafaria cholistanensis]
MNGTGTHAVGTNAAVRAAVGGLIRDTLEVYRDDPAACALLRGYAERMGEPVRVALAGLAKSGKTTLLNAIVGEGIALEEARRHPHLVVWYRYGPAPRATAHSFSGQSRPLRLDRRDGRLVVDLGGPAAQEVERLVIEWPAEGLRSLTLIDTPGPASPPDPNPTRPLEPAGLPEPAAPGGLPFPPRVAAEADAVVYLMRHPREADLDHLRALRDAAAPGAGAANVLVVLSRADEIGAGRIGSLISAGACAEQYARGGALRDLALGVVPVAGLLARAARTLHREEFGALVQLAGLDRSARERLLLSADRFVRSDGPEDMDPDLRARLLERFGLFGIRLAAALIRGGTDRPLPLSRELARRSGLAGLLELISAGFVAQGSRLKACAVLDGIEALLRTRPRPGAIRLAESLERVRANAQDFPELRTAARVHGGRLPVEPWLAAEAGRLVGGGGDTPAERLGMAGGDASDGELRARALECLGRWRRAAANPLADRAALEDYRTVIRSCEAALALLAPAAGPDRVRVLLRPEPGTGPVQHAQHQRHPAQR